MKTAIALLIVASSLGCTHVSRGTRVDDLSDPNRQIYEWSRVDGNHTLREKTRTTVVEDDRQCRDVRVRRSFYTETGALERRVVERKRCGYVEMRFVERYDDGGDLRIREVYLDKDHNGEFERQLVRQEPMVGEGPQPEGWEL